MLDNGPANLLAIKKSNESDLRLKCRNSLENLIISRFPKHKLHLSMAGAVELLRFAPQQRPHQQSWFQQHRDDFLCLETAEYDRSQRLAELWEALEKFYEPQCLSDLFLSKLKACQFVASEFTSRIRIRLEELLDADFSLRISLLYILDDIQIATARKNSESEPMAAYQILDAINRSGVIKNYPSILRVVANIIEIGRDRFFSERKQNEFGLKELRDIFDCDLASSVVLGSHSNEELHPVDVLSLEETPILLKRAMAVRTTIIALNKFLREKFKTKDNIHAPIKLQQGRVFYLCNENSNYFRIRRIFEISNLREGAMPRL